MDISRNQTIASKIDPRDLLQRLLENPNVEIPTADLTAWIIETARRDHLLEQYASFWEANRLDTAEDLCERLEKFLLSFIADQACWQKDQLKTTIVRLVSVLKLYKPIVEVYIRPPNSIFRRLDGFQRNLFRIQPYVKQDAAVAVLLETIVELCELWFLKLRCNGYKLMANCVLYLLSKPKLTGATLKRLNSWSDYFLLFRVPIVTKDDADISIRNLFPDLDPEEWEEEERENSTPRAVPQALMELEKIDYLIDAILQLFSRPEAVSSPEGRKLLTSLLTINRDFMNVGRIAIDDLMSSHQHTKQLDAIADIVIKAWMILQKISHPLRFDLEAIIITDLMQRSLRTDSNYKTKFLSKYCLMVSHMYNCTETVVRRMFHSNYDLMVLDTVKSENVTLRTNALRMLGKCFPLCGPDIPKNQHAALISQQVDTILLNMKHACPDFRSAAACAAGDALNRAWALIKIPERSQLLSQLSGRLVCDDSSIPVRLAAVKAVVRVLEQPLSRLNMVPVLTAMKVMATDEAIPVRVEYYSCLLQAVQLGLLAVDGGDAILDTDQLLLHFVERDRPYVSTIEQILDQMVWNVDNLGLFLRNSVHLWLEQPAVAVKCFQTIPKTKSAEEIHLVLDCIFGQVCQALRNHAAKEVDLPNAPLTMMKPAHVNAAIELAGTIWAATVLVLSQKPELNHEIQTKAVILLTKAVPFTDVLKEVNLYRLACRVPDEAFDNYPECRYYQWCFEQLKNVPSDRVEEGITLMTFVNAWGKASDLLKMARQWLDLETQATAGKRKRETGGTATEEKRAHLGLLYLSMLMSDPDISGTFSDMDAEIMALAEKSVEAFLRFLPNRFSRNPRFDFPVDDRFYGNVLVFLTVCYINHIHYTKDPSVFRDHFHKILIKIKEHVCEWLGLGMPANVIYAIKNYKDRTKELMKKREAFPGAHKTVGLAGKLMETLQDVLQQLTEVSKMEDEELQLQLLGCTQAAKKLPQVTLVTPSLATPRVSPSKGGRGKRKKV